MSQSNLDLQLGSLEFDSIKSSIIEHLKKQDVLKDYDYQGSAAQVLLDILAYNTMYYGHYANMIASEMFLDTAQKESSIISLVKPLGYVVPGKTSATGRAKIRVGGANNDVPIYTKFTGNAPNGQFYNFFTTEEHVLDDQGENIVNIKEAKSLIRNEPLIVDSNTKKGFIYGLDIDISTIRVEVKDVADGEWKPWTLISNIQQGLNETSQVFWLERSELGFFIVFGGGFDSAYGQVGQEIFPNQLVQVSYFKSSGSAANGVGNYTLRDFSPSNGDPPPGAHAVDAEGGLSSGGTDKPDIEAIRFFAPKWFASQNRAVTLEDCRGVLAEAGFAGDSESGEYSRFNVWGGETMTPPRYGRLFLSLDVPEDEDPGAVGHAIEVLQSKTCVTIIPEFMNVDMFSVIVEATIPYDSRRTTNDENTLASLIRAKVLSNLPNRFNLHNVNPSYISSAINSVDPASLGSNTSDINLKLLKKVPVKSTGRIAQQRFHQPCEQGSFESDDFALHLDYYNSLSSADRPENYHDMVVLKTDGPVDKKGYQKLKITWGLASQEVGQWHPYSGVVDISLPLFSENINFYVKPVSTGLGGFKIIENMYAADPRINMTLVDISQE